MKLDILEKYINLCDVLSIKPSWKGLNEYYNYNRRKIASFTCSNFTLFNFRGLKTNNN